MKNNYIEVTFLFESEDAFKKFVKKNCGDEYTYRKGKYIVDMTNETKQAMSDMAERNAAPVEEPKVETPTTDELPSPEPQQESMF